MATVPEGQSIVWYDAVTNGNVIASPTLNTVGTITYYAQAVNDNTSCISLTRTAVTLTIKAASATPISGGDQNVCGISPIQTLTATATVPEGQSVVWYDAAANGNVIANPTLNTVGTVTYYAQAVNDNSSCTSLTRTAVTLTINTCSIVITKDGTYTDTNNDGITNIGDNVSYNFVVTNTGNVPLTNITVTDINAVVSGGPIATLAAGAVDTTTFTAVHAITQAEINAGLIYNLATATGTPPIGEPVTDTSSDPTPCTTCPEKPDCPDCTITPLTQNPGLEVTKTAITY